MSSAAIQASLPQIEDAPTRLALRLVADSITALASALAQLQQSSGTVRLTATQIAQIRSALQASGTHPLPLTGLAGAVKAISKVTSQWLDSYAATSGTFTQSQPQAADLANGIVGTGAVVLKTGATSVSFADPFSVTGLQVFANNAAAVAGGLAVGRLYRSGADPDGVFVVH